MGADLPAVSMAARKVFEAADSALGFSLSALCFNGPDETLRETVNAQPAIVIASLALLAALQESLVEGQSNSSPSTSSASSWATPLTPDFTAGHSVGEYAALVAAGALTLGDAARLVRERGRLMHHEGTLCPGGMAAVIGMDEGPLQDICREVTARQTAHLPSGAHAGQGHVTIANFNAPGQIVISGEQAALEAAMLEAKARGAKRVIPLAVSGAFHSPVMQPAAAGLATAIAAAHVQDASIPVIGNMHATPLTKAGDIRAELAQQIAASVQWVRTVEYLARAGVSVFLEIGPGQALTGMVKRIVKGATALNLSSAADLAKVASTLREIGRIV